MLQALLVDDEEKNLSSLEFLLHNDCDEVKVIGKAQSVDEAENFLKKHVPEVVFLDITMPGKDGFQLLGSIDSQKTKVIFVTAHNQFALKALKASAVDYLLKPVLIEDLQNAIEKVKKSFKSPFNADQEKLLLEHYREISQQMISPRKIAVPALGSIKFISLDEVISLQADSNYTIIHIKNMHKIVISKTLKDFEELLDENEFVRIHKSYIVNLSYVKEYNSYDGVVKMFDGNQWSISRRQLELFLEKMKKFTLMFGKVK